MSLVQTTCCIAGCGPAGAMLGYLLARAGVDVVVLERHGDFLRDFRGDTIHPSTLEVLDQVGLATKFLELPHSEVSTVFGRTAAGQTVMFSLKRLPSRYRFIAFVPQWDFLEFVTQEATKYPTFHLLRHAEVAGLVEREGAIRGVRYRSQGGEHEIEALLTVGADGRASVTRLAAGLPMTETSPPMDVLWFRLSRHPEEPVAVAGRLGSGRVLVMINRGEYWQIAYVISKGTAAKVQAAGLDAFRAEISRVAPDLADRVGDIRSWDDVKLLTVRADRLLRWHRPGYLAIGDAAHAMSPIGGLGINVAIQDAVAAANLLWKPLAERRLSDADLERVQQARELPVRVMQSVQAFVQNRFLKPTLDGTRPPTIPLGARLVARIPVLRDVPGRLIGLGIRRPRVESPDAFAPTSSARLRPGSAS